ncbi:S-type anion channel SLAH2-like [Actinidia eriantha]|uniref:S-type anion channel SLAH2-like n=1 Tax=Actinidia eriantha TaxID=165200 RepID=UPI00258349E1|nr:S-type anion channel SLAH2-like [Actinidia eriantha]XP_057464234.1 S-type anion channel SLAH2-like [Actinidia eriantha]
MESSERPSLSKQDSPEVLPPLIKFITVNEVAGFGSVEEKNFLDNQHHQTGFRSFSTSATSGHSQSQRIHSVSISMPSSPTEVQLQSTNRVIFRDHDGTVLNNDSANSSSASTNVGPIQAKFCSHPILAGSSFDEVVASGLFPNCPELPPKNPRTERLKDKRFDSFKTWSGKLERQLSHLRGKPQETGSEANPAWNVDVETLPVGRYFDALEGPELDTLRASEEILLPEDKQWPFLLRFPISSFGICLGVSSQAIMWKRLATSASTKFLHISLNANLILWYIAVALVAIISVIYLLKVIFYFEAVRREYYHPIRINFFFAPLITLLFLALGVPPSVAQNLHAALWYILMTPIFCLELKIYGQWMSGGQRRLSKVANPSNHLSILGNFVGALLGASMGLKEGPIFFFAVGLAHYTVLFVTLYQRLPTNVTLPKDLHPVFFLFVAAPSVASLSWAGIQDSFDYGSRIAYFLALFLYFSLAVRVNFFRGFRFSLSWWAYTFPMTAAAIATIKYCNEVPSIVTKSLSVILSAIATLVVISLLVTTILHAFVLRDLFPNDIAIAISEKRPKTTRKWFPWRTSSPEKDIENYLKFVDSVRKDIEACPTPSSSITKAVDKLGTI